MKNNILKILSIVLFSIILLIIVILLATYFLDNENNNSNNIQQNEIDNPKEEQINYEEIISDVKNKFEFAFEYANLIISYCGEHTVSDRVASHGNQYNVSTQFTSYDEMQNYLKTYMSEEVIKNSSKYNISRENYIEENGKLYCETFGKGSGYSYGDSIIEIKSITDNKITAIAMKELIVSAVIPTVEYQKINLILEKENNNYIITSYEIQD